MIDLRGKAALVTGSSRGIGRAIALAMAQAGADVAVNYLANAEAAQETAEAVKQAGRRTVVIQADVADPKQATALVEQATQQLGEIDVLVNNAGVLIDKPLSRMTDDEWQRVLDVCLTGAFNCTRAVSMQMRRRKSGRIINISSVAGLMGDMARVNYCAAKAGMIGLTKAAARELAGQDICVNAVAPGMIESDITAKLNPVRREGMLKVIPFRRFGKAEEVAALVTFLASDAAAYITGQVFCIDGGLSM